MYLQFAVCFYNSYPDNISVKVIRETYIKTEKGTREMNILLLWSRLRMDKVYSFQLQRTAP